MNAHPSSTVGDMRNEVVYVVDDDAENRGLLEQLLESVDLAVESCATAAAFLAAYEPARVSCLILDVRMPGMSGLELQRMLNSAGAILPVIMVSAHADVTTAVTAMKAGAFDFLVKPFDNQEVLDLVHRALAHARSEDERRRWHAEIVERYRTLTGREREVTRLVVAGEPNKRIAHVLGVSGKTVEYHRARIMEKMQAASLPELVRMALVVDAAAPDDAAPAPGNGAAPNPWSGT